MSRRRKQQVQSAPSTNGHNRINGQTVRRLSVAAPATATKTRGAIAKGQKPDKLDWVTLGTEIDEDPAFTLGSLAYKSIIAKAEISIEGGSDDPKATRLTEHLIELWYKHLGEALHCFEHGRSVFEQVRPYDRDAALHLPELIHQPTKECEMKLDPEGNYDGFTLKVQGADPVTVSARESWWMALDPQPLNPHGRSKYAGGPWKVYQRIKRLRENQETFLDQFALGQLAVFAPVQLPEGRQPFYEGNKGQVDDSGEPVNLLQQVADRLKDVESGGAIVLPSENWPADYGGGPMYRFEAIPRTTSIAPLESQQANLNDEALKSIGVPPRALTQEGEVGTNAQSVAHQRILINNAEQILDQLVASFQEQVVDPAVQVNWPAGQRPTLTLTYGNIDPSLVALALEIVRQTVAGQISPLITEGVLDFPKLLDQVRLPVGDNLPARLAAVKSASAPQPAPGGPMQFSQSRRLSSPPATIAKTQEAHEARTKREAASYWDQMFAALESGLQLDDDGNFVGLDPEALRELEEIEHEIDDVRREGTVASAVSGYLTPFSADVQPEQVKRADTIEPDFVPRDTRTNPAQRAD